MAHAAGEGEGPGRPWLPRRPALAERRAFLRFAAAAGGATLLSSCTGTGASSTATGSPTAPVSAAGGTHGAVGVPTSSGAVRASGPPKPADWAALARDLSGPLVRPGEAGYATARLLFDPRFDSLHPAGIAYCASPHDVTTCLAFVRRHGVPVAARSGGHSYAGWSSTSGLIVDVTRMAGVSVSGGTAVVGAGTRLIDFYNGLAAYGRGVPGGSCPTVGIAGLTLGGGVGVVSRAYGMTSDNVLSLQIVTADGRVRTCGPGRDPDLYWACRGGGGGNFGVVTSFTFRTHPVGEIILFFLSWPWSAAGQVIAGWQSWAPHAPDALWSNLHLAAAPGGSIPSIQVGGTYLGSVGDAYAELGKLYAAVGSEPSSPFLESTTWLHAMLVEAGCASQTVGECHLPTQNPAGQLSRASEYAKSDFFTRPLSSSGIGTLLSGVENLQLVNGAPGGSGGIAFDAMGGAVNRVAPAATAYVHRDALFQAQYTTGWTPGAAPAGVASQRAWQRAFWRSMRPYASGQAYQNYIDPDLTGWRQAYYGANYARLTRVKAAYDPDRVFTFPQAI
jgi:FAD/FMN-containing dehydrogenase